MIPSDESLDAFFGGRITLYQSRTGYRFSLDALLLAHFVTVKTGARIIFGAGLVPGISSMLARMGADRELRPAQCLFHLQVRARHGTCRHLNAGATLAPAPGGVLPFGLGREPVPARLAPWLAAPRIQPGDERLRVVPADHLHRAVAAAAVAAALTETGATSIKQMGVVMKAAQAKLAGKRVDGKALGSGDPTKTVCYSDPLDTGVDFTESSQVL